MKKTILIVSFFALSFAVVSCNKNEAKNESKQETVSYKGTDGTRANATFETTKKGGTVTIIANKGKYELDKISDTLYERNGVKAEVKGDSLIIKQGDIEIPLVKAIK